MHANPDLLRFIPTAALSGPDEAASWITRASEATGPHRGWWCAVRHDGTPVGAVLLKPIRHSAGRRGDAVEVGWRLHPAHTGHGYATEAAELLLAAGLGSGLRRILAVVDPENAASQAVCRRLGMTFLGDTEDYYDTRLRLFEVTGAG